MLIFDSKTRWNSLQEMSERFLKVKHSSAKAVLNINMEMDIKNGEFKLLKDIVAALQLVKVGAKRMRCRGTLLCAEGMFSFMLI